MIRGMDDLITPIREYLQAMTQAERKAFAESAGVPFPTLQKIATGETDDPRINTWAAIASAMGGVCAIPRAVPPAPTFQKD
jgi:predicted transcriptional regulator